MFVSGVCFSCLPWDINSPSQNKFNQSLSISQISLNSLTISNSSYFSPKAIVYSFFLPSRREGNLLPLPLGGIEVGESVAEGHQFGIIKANNFISFLRGRVKFPTGGEAAQAKPATRVQFTEHAVDLVRFQSRQ